MKPYSNVTEKQNKRIWAWGCLFAAALVFCVLLFLSMGPMALSIEKTYTILLGKLTHSQELLSSVKANEIAVVWDIRLPRILTGIFVGMGLAASGAIFQSILMNPLADPYTLGVSTGAAFGASLALLLNLTYGVMVSTTASAFLWAFLTLITVIAISQKGGGMLSSNLIIAGIIVSAILSSGISFMKMEAGEDVGAIVFWLMGSLSAASWKDVLLVCPIVLPCFILSLFFSKDLNIMATGEYTALSLGVNTKRIRLFYLIIGSIMTAACVSVSGIIGFVGLIVPHLLRYALTRDNSRLLPLSALLGALLLMASDNLTRLLTNGEVPVGVLTTLLGGPFFIYVFLKRKPFGEEKR